MKKITGFLLYFIAIISYLPLLILNFLVVLWKNRNTYRFLETMNNYTRQEAFNMDIYANQSFNTLWDTTLRKKGGYKFGKQGETISSVLGKNQRDKTLSTLGFILTKILDFIEKDHCLNAINDEI